jgi:hypothetical protein
VGVSFRLCQHEQRMTVGYERTSTLKRQLNASLPPKDLIKQLVYYTIFNKKKNVSATIEMSCNSELRTFLKITKPHLSRLQRYGSDGSKVHT